MGLYRKLPVVIEARQTGVGYDEDCSIMAWCGGAVHDVHAIEGSNRLFSLDTLEGVMWVEVGDYVIKGVAGEFYPCKPDIFAATYEAVEA